MLRPRVALCVAFGALSACSGGGARPGPPVVFTNAHQAAESICIAPPSSRKVLAAVRDLNWPAAPRPDLPREMGEDNVEWSEIVASPRHDLLVAVGRLSGTSFCRVYVREAQAHATRTGLEEVHVLGARLGTSDFHRNSERDDVTGWHRRDGGDWRAVHLSVATVHGAQPDRSPAVIEVTRSVS